MIDPAAEAVVPSLNKLVPAGLSKPIVPPTETSTINALFAAISPFAGTAPEAAFFWRITVTSPSVVVSATVSTPVAFVVDSTVSK